MDGEREMEEKMLLTNYAKEKESEVKQILHNIPRAFLRQKVTNVIYLNILSPNVEFVHVVNNMMSFAFFSTEKNHLLN